MKERGRNTSKSMNFLTILTRPFLLAAFLAAFVLCISPGLARADIFYVDQNMFQTPPAGLETPGLESFINPSEILLKAEAWKTELDRLRNNYVNYDFPFAQEIPLGLGNNTSNPIVAIAESAVAFPILVQINADNAPSAMDLTWDSALKIVPFNDAGEAQPALTMVDAEPADLTGLIAEAAKAQKTFWIFEANEQTEPVGTVITPEEKIDVGTYIIYVPIATPELTVAQPEDTIPIRLAIALVDKKPEGLAPATEQQQIPPAFTYEGLTITRELYEGNEAAIGLPELTAEQKNAELTIRQGQKLNSSTVKDLSYNAYTGLIVLEQKFKPGSIVLADGSSQATFKDNFVFQATPSGVVFAESNGKPQAWGPYAFWVADANGDYINFDADPPQPITDQEYTIYYTVEVAQGAFDFTTRVLAPATTAVTGQGPYVGTAAQQGDSSLKDQANLYALLINPKNYTLGEGNELGTLDTGFEYIINPKPDNEKSVQVSIDLRDVFNAIGQNSHPKYVTLVQSFTVPTLKEDQEFVHPLNLTKIPAEGSNPAIPPAVNLKTFGDNAPTYAIFGPTAPSDQTFDENNYLVWIEGTIEEVNNNYYLKQGETYNVFYSVPVSTTDTTALAESNVAVLTRTAIAQGPVTPTHDVPATLPTDGLPLNVQPGVKLPLANGVAELTFTLSPTPTPDFTAAELPAGNKSIGLGAQSFEISGFQEGDTHLLQRKFTYVRPDGVTEDTVQINANNIILHKYIGNTAHPLTLVGGADVNLNDADFVANMDGKFWLQKVGEFNYIDTTDTSRVFENGAEYIVYFAIKNGGTFDESTDDHNTIKDPNFLSVGSGVGAGSSKSSSGCSVGGTSAYDMALIMLLALGLLGLRTLRVRTRKN